MRSVLRGLVLAVGCVGMAFAQEEPAEGAWPPTEEQPVGLDEGTSMGEEPDFTPPEDAGTGGSGEDLTALESPREASSDPWRVMAGAGVEAYAGDLASRLNPGPMTSVVLSVRATPWLRAEAGYSGAANEVDQSVAPGPERATDGVDLWRNGAHLAVTANAPGRVAEPYVLAGLGMDWYDFRGTEGQAGFSDDTTARIPLGVGLRVGGGRIFGDARLQYDAVLSQGFAETPESDSVSGAYSARVHLGGQF